MNVLVAEDDRMLRSIMVEFLEDFDCSVHAVSNGQEAVAALQECSYDAVFMDCEMPVMDGLTAARTVMEEGGGSGMKAPPIIALTGHTDPDDHVRCLEAGMVAVLTKPVNISELETLLNRFASL